MLQGFSPKRLHWAEPGAKKNCLRDTDSPRDMGNRFGTGLLARQNEVDGKSRVGNRSARGRTMRGAAGSEPKAGKRAGGLERLRLVDRQMEKAGEGLVREAGVCDFHAQLVCGADQGEGC